MSSPDPVVRSLLEQVNAELKRRGMTKSELAGRMLTDLPTVRRTLNGRSEHIGSALLIRFAHALGMEPTLTLVPKEESTEPN